MRPESPPPPPTADSWHVNENLNAFLSQAGAFLRSRPDLHTQVLTVAETLRTGGARTYGEKAPWFGVLEEAGQVRAACFRTPPHRLVTTPLTTAQADALAARLLALGRPVSGVNAVRDTAGAFAASWSRRTGATTGPRPHGTRLHRLGALVPPDPAPPGRARIAGRADRELLALWFGEFQEAIGESGRQDADAWTDTRLAYDGLALWETPDGTPVAMAGISPLLAGMIRVAPVYTPASLRRRGYAAAVTAAITRTALDRGADQVLLFTDLANPTTNALYRRLGYHPVADFTAYDFS
ncbi:GNAT family N-acetyltransferase [Streptomyces griseorubiginosus]|uniref:GNAT family N-acetyltransferase n=1 Tax=Streptomyces griseorubiginosus TaxID=67304 RepID=UPI00114025CF|nr:GNAT family N-acetyltransferase [Streptomyces griseorubiginosus]